MRFIKVNELKLTRVILVFALMCVAANAFEVFCMAHLANIERFLYNSSLKRKSTQMREGAFTFGNE